MKTFFPSLLAAALASACTPVRAPAETGNSLALHLKASTFPQGGEDQDRKKFRDSLSGIALSPDGKHLFLACDETVNQEPTLEQLTRQPDGSYGDHQPLLVSSFMPLISSDKDKDGYTVEIDTEALAVSGGYLWFLGSHSANRKQAKSDDSTKKNLKRLAEVDLGPNRQFIGRIPLADDGQLVAQAGDRKAGRLTDASPGWDLFSLLKNKEKEDEHFGRFFTLINDIAQPVIPSKDNGFDIEGMAVVGHSVYLGLRGPVLRGMACILEIRVKDADDGGLKLDAFEDGAPYHKHFVDLGGLGVRDLHADGDNLWILSGPTMALDVPTNLRLWKNAFTTMKDGDTVTFGDKADISNIKEEGKKWQAFFDLAPLAAGDHPEGIALLPQTDASSKKMVIIYDGPKAKQHLGENTTDAKADVLPLPATP